ncbi:helix-turn-helix domain-containing protein [Halostella sp. JP-L12]|uniref:helix-turn-helix domain-containing protein n=1 Tax=Halostella TaxID=1843185 RepID=UPI000EF831AA|nr:MULTISPECIES: helix-turn-helix domain-containing protein [Halostella]NHN46639.1 helix-turn-helix domain-containing protein [Halostella sp. JP-L12]
MREALVSLDESELAAVGLEELVSICRSAGIEDFEEFACYGDGAIVQVEVAARLDEKRFASLDYVDRWERLAESDGSHLYLIAFTAPGIGDAAADHADDLVGCCEPTLTDNGATMSFVGPQAAISGIVDEYERAGLSPDLRKIAAYDGRRDSLDALTDRQREVVRTAYEMGYYEVPREVSTAEIAGELDLDGSTVAEHLQRAERNLLSNYLGQ